MLEHRRREPAPGVFRLVLPLPFEGLARVNAYLLAGDDHDVLVDCGIYFPDPTDDHGYADLDAALRACGSAPERLQALVITHPHIDHYGLAGSVVEKTGCELWMHEAYRADLEMYRDAETVAARVRSMFADHGVTPDELDEITAFEDWRAFVSELIEPSRPLAAGDGFKAGTRVWETIYTPGHARSHICLWTADERLLISGDHLLPAITPHIDFRRGDEDPLGDYLASLERVEQLDPALVLPGHGHPFPEGADRARAILRHHDRRLGSILQVVRKQPHTASQITDEIFTGALLNFQRRLALGEALAHLAYLRRQGEVERIRRDDGTYEYRKVGRRSDG